MREFQTAVSKADSTYTHDPALDTKFLHDGTEVTFHAPTPGQFALFTAMGVGHTGISEVSTFIALMFEFMDEDTKRYFRRRLLDSSDPFDAIGEGGLADIATGLIEEWSARPTQSPSGSSTPPGSTGRRSTAKRASKVKTS